MRTIVKSTMLTALILISILVGCKDDDDIVVKVTNVTLNKTMLTLTEGGSETITATIEPQDATNKTVTWRSSNSAIATVDNTGKVTAVKKGDATITVTTKDGNKTATCKVIVKSKVIAVTEVKLNKNTITKLVGETEQLTASVLPQNATNKNVKWASSDNTIASVDNTGMVTAIKEGNTAITVTTEDGNKTATCKISVKATAPKVKMTLVTTKSVGEQIKLVTRADANNQNSVWIDLNNNGTKDADEKVTNFTDTVIYTIGAQTINIYGKVTEFDCQKNDIKELKVGQNKYLTYLACRENQITQLDVTLNKNLKTLYCLRNPLQQLDVTQNTELIDLNCRYTQLQQLDVGKNKKLKILDCSYTSLGRLDISNNKQIRGLYCKEIGLKELDITQNKELEELDCYGNYINDLNLKNNTKLKYLECSKNSLNILDVTSNKDLIYLSCNENSLTELDVSNNKKLVFLWCADSPNLSSLNVANGNNKNFKYPYGGDYFAFNSSNCTSLTCIQVDKSFNPDAQTGIGQKWKKDDSASWNNSGDSCEDLFGTKMTLVTTKSVGKQIKLVTRADANNQNSVWIDLNNNGTKDANEEINNFTDTVSYTIGAQTINIYGKVTEFDCQKNDITELKVGQNKYLTYLACRENQITQLDVTLNKNLKTLYCLRNPLQQLDVTQNTELIDLNCRYTQLQQLDVSKNKKLKILDCSYTSLGRLDISNNKQIRGLYCKEIGLKELDITQNKELEELDCYGNYINDLNLKNNTKLKYLECSKNSLNILDVTSNKDLIYLSCNENSLTELDVSNNKKLVFLWCADSPNLSSLNVANGNNKNFKYPYGGDYFAFNSSNCTSLTCIQVDKSFNPDAQTGIGQKWKKDDSASWNNSGDSCEDLFGTKMTLVTTKSVGKQIKLVTRADANNQNSVWIDLNNNGTKDADEKVTNFTDTVSYTIGAQTINIYGTITHLNCSSNYINKLDVTQNPHLIHLNCSGGNRLTSLDVTNNKNLTYLDCSGGNMLKTINLNNNTKLQHLNLSMTFIYSLDVSKNTELTYLNCAHNNLKELDVSNNTKLESLECLNGNIEALDVSKNKDLVILNLFKNKVKKLDVTNNTKLTLLACHNNKISVLDISKNTELELLRCEVNNLKELDVSNNKKLIALRCNNNKSLRKLNVANGNNKNFKYPLDSSDDIPAFQAINCPYLKCIQVDEGFEPDSQTEKNTKWKKDDSASWNNSGKPCE